jgi:dTDP-4-amino-4,6-dideoxygalactose transaminase
VHLTQAYSDLGYTQGSFPVAEQAAGQILSLPLFPHISPAQQEYVASTLRAAVRAG